MFLVRKGNPKGIKDWGDLVKPGVQVITPNPKTSGGARWNYLAALGLGAASSRAASDAKAKEFVAQLFKHVPVLDTGARGSTTTFVQRGIGDVLLAWENEAFLAVERAGQGQVRDRRAAASASSPSRRWPWSTRSSTRRSTRAVAEAYLKFLYSPEGQEIAAKHYYRPERSEGAAEKHKAELPAAQARHDRQEFGGWAVAQKTHFADGGMFDQIYQPGSR